jgi:ATP-dependent helicase/DNAse subunit B
LRITAFRDYLACPYRFYLKHVEGLEAVSDSLDELDGGGFGSLAHEVLRRFGAGKSRHSIDALEIQEALERELDRCAAEMFGSRPLPSLLVQVEQLRWRLRAFAEKQAAWSGQGWRIEHVEVDVGEACGAKLNVDGQPFGLTGRMDRIDVHATTGERVIFDYKTADAGDSPQGTHCCRDKWIDLQLPLYRHLAAALGIVGPIRLGYIVLPKDCSSTQFVLAEWDAASLESADECARAVVRGIRAQVFFPPADPPPKFYDDFGPICQDGVLDR